MTPDLLGGSAAKCVAEPTFDDVVRLVADDLREVELLLHREIRSSIPEVQRVLEQVRLYRGKRLRPMLLLLSARLFGVVRPEHHLLAVVLEMIHTATLIHDDILDGAHLRRHQPTLHVSWGVPAAVLAGDYLFSHAFTLASQTGSTLACQLIGQVTNRVCEGEMHQSLCQNRFELSEEEYFTIIRAKTAELTSLACRLGALFSQAPPQQVEALAEYGLHLGLAFQISDDLLDFIGDEKRAGKSLGTDWTLAKLTLPVIYWRDQLTPQQRQYYIQAWRHHQLPLAELRCLLEQCGALSAARQRAAQHVQYAEQALSYVPLIPERFALQALAQFTIRREL
ncbi:MAG: polyprenyl synthetase family protein [Gemmatales bacterium]|nr:polyprenyl synthetase family protein [Gemmatales bacterium]MDW8222112.1 polyprenyl synthetase family protein [Gemmatales bacterium]